MVVMGYSWPKPRRVKDDDEEGTSAVDVYYGLTTEPSSGFLDPQELRECGENICNYLSKVLVL